MHYFYGEYIVKLRNCHTLISFARRKKKKKKENILHTRNPESLGRFFVVVMCHVSHFMCHVSRLTGHMSLTPTATATAPC